MDNRKSASLKRIAIQGETSNKTNPKWRNRGKLLCKKLAKSPTEAISRFKTHKTQTKTFASSDKRKMTQMEIVTKKP